MGFLGIGAPDVDWSVALADGRIDAQPGGRVSATVSLRPRGPLDARRIMASFSGTEEYAYERETRDSEGRSTSREWSTNELWKQEVQLSGPARIGARETRALEVGFDVPPDAAPSFESGVLRVRWRLAAWVDVGGRDPRVEQLLVVPVQQAALAGLDPFAFQEQVPVIAAGAQAAIWVQPAPLRAAAPFSGVVDSAVPLDPGRTAVEIKLTVATLVGSAEGAGASVGGYLLGKVGLPNSADSGVSETVVVSRSGIAEVAPPPGWRRYAFGGQIPPGVVTAVFPHAAATATVDVVVSRAMRRDDHIVRPVAIVIG